MNVATILITVVITIVVIIYYLAITVDVIVSM